MRAKCTHIGAKLGSAASKRWLQNECERQGQLRRYQALSLRSPNASSKPKPLSGAGTHPPPFSSSAERVEANGLSNHRAPLVLTGALQAQIKALERSNSATLRASHSKSQCTPCVATASNTTPATKAGQGRATGLRV